MTSRAGRAVALLLPALAAGCGAAPAPPTAATDAAASLTIVQGGEQVVQAGSVAPEPAVVVVRDAAGRPLAGAHVAFSAGDGGWVMHSRAVTDSAGRAATTWHAGPQAGITHRLVASTGPLAAEFRLRTTPPVAGRDVHGTDGYILFAPGDLPIIFSVPHGGELMPDALPDRTGDVTTVRDAHTIELAREIADAFARRTGRRPSLVMSMLHRRKLDPNRPIEEAAQSHASAERAWREYHGFIEAARSALAATGRPGIYIDLHGHGHEMQRVELGYMLRSSELALSDATLNSRAMVERSSLRAFATLPGSHAPLVRGPLSLGALLEQRGFPAVPSPTQPDPGLAPYFSGGYSTWRHGSGPEQAIVGMQVEANLEGVRDTAANRRRFADALVDALLEFAMRWSAAAVQTPFAAAGGR
jgi:hypothetical protein